MGFLWTLIGLALIVAVFWFGARLFAGAPRPAADPQRRPEPADQKPARDLDANINPSQTGNLVDKWPDRTGARTQAELGARTGAVPHNGDPVTPGVRREINPGPHEHGPGTRPASLAPEAEFGEDRPANRTVAPDQPPTQWHPKDAGSLSGYVVDEHRRPASGPAQSAEFTTRSGPSADPMAHAQVPGPNHIPPPDGQELLPGKRP